MTQGIKTEENLGITGRVRVITYKAGTKEILRVSPWSKNRIMLGTNTGKSLILQRLIGTNTYSLNVNYGDIGTGTTTPADSDTTLQTAVKREALSSSSISSNVASLYFYFPDADLTNGSYYEFAMFVDGTATISTGKIFNRVLFSSAYTKATGEDSTIQVDITLT